MSNKMKKSEYDEIKNSTVTFAAFDPKTGQRCGTFACYNYKQAMDKMIYQTALGRVCQVLTADFEHIGLKLNQKTYFSPKN